MSNWGNPPGSPEPTPPNDTPRYPSPAGGASQSGSGQSENVQPGYTGPEYTQQGYGQGRYDQGQSGPEQYGQGQYGQGQYGQGQSSQQAYDQQAYGQQAYGQSSGAAGAYSATPSPSTAAGAYAPAGAPGLPAYSPQSAAKPGIMAFRPQGVGDAIDVAFNGLRRAFGVSVLLPFLSVLLPVLILVVAAVIAAGSASSDTPPVLFFVVLGLGLLLALVMNFACTGGLIHVFSEAVLGRKTHLSSAIKVGVSRAPSLIGLFFLYALIWLAISIVAIVLIMIAGAAFDQNASGFVIAVLLLVLVGSCAAVWLFVRLSLAPYSLVMEQVGPVTALKRSWALTRKRFWRTFGTMLLVYVVITIVSMVLQFLVSLMILAPLGIQDSSSDASAWLTGAALVGSVVTLVVLFLINALTTPFMIYAMGTVYLDARIRDEGLASSLIAAAQSPGAGVAAPARP